MSGYPETAASRLIAASPRGEAVAMDFKKSTVTFKVGPETSLQGGLFFLVRQDDAVALAQRVAGYVEMSPSAMEAEVDSHGDWISVKRGNCQWHYWFIRHSEKRREITGTWVGSEERTDSRGVEWLRSLPAMVMDNFGDLVPVDGGVL